MTSEHINWTQMDTEKIAKSRVYLTANAIDYVANSMVIKTILQKSTGSVSLISVDGGKGIGEKTYAFDTYIQLIDGEAEIVISGNSNLLYTGDSIIVPAHLPIFMKSSGRFKMIVTVIKSGYD